MIKRLRGAVSSGTQGPRGRAPARPLTLWGPLTPRGRQAPRALGAGRRRPLQQDVGAWACPASGSRQRLHACEPRRNGAAMRTGCRETRKRCASGVRARGGGELSAPGASTLHAGTSEHTRYFLLATGVGTHLTPGRIQHRPLIYNLEAFSVVSF